MLLIRQHVVPLLTIANCFLTWNLRDINFVGKNGDGFGLDLINLEEPNPEVDPKELGIWREKVERMEKEAKLWDGKVNITEKRLYQTASKKALETLAWGPPLPDSPPIPKTIHYILIDRPLDDIPEEWREARLSCLGLHPDWEFKFWDRDAAESFFEREHPWFLDEWRGYKYPIQRADALRYFVLYSYGGVYLDMDLACRRSLDPFRRFDFLSPAAHPVGVSNGFMMSPPRAPLLNRLIQNLTPFNHFYFSAYPTVMFSTGCMFLSAHLNIFRPTLLFDPVTGSTRREQIKVLGGVRNKLSGRVTTPLFRHLGASSWHQDDARVYSNLGKFLKKVPIFGGSTGGEIAGAGWLSAALLVATAIGFGIWWRRLRKRKAKGGKWAATKLPL
ncbi:hypothetical protein HK097_002371 [Rhizophlyctis rosea]|uniref:Glycosyltransferase family 32 protein n=1 Tax=Rhizophlyctis rosea TaxID=64517 RepID=A0AAD5X079_9FUNG|nr:hypothetical protein HK097_002371 [Rhizophlyctis rosea]